MHLIDVVCRGDESYLNDCQHSDSTFYCSPRRTAVNCYGMSCNHKNASKCCIVLYCVHERWNGLRILLLIAVSANMLYTDIRLSMLS